MKKQILAVSITAALSSPVFASIPLATYGASTTLGQTASPITINSVRYNPAAGYAVLDHDSNEQVRFGYWSQVGGSVEFGSADNFEEDIDRLTSRLDELDASPDVALAAAIQTEFNTILERFGEAGTLKLAGTVSVPGFPIALKTGNIDGVFTLDAAFSTFAKVSFLDAPLELGTGAETGTLNTDSSVYIQGVGILQLGLGYSQSVYKVNSGALTGELVVGGRANAYSASFSRQVTGIDSDEGSFSDIVNDGLDQKDKYSSAFGVDLGAAWFSDFYHVGLMGKNLNSPELKSSSLSGNDLAAAFSSKLDIGGTYELEPQFTLDGSVFTQERMLMLAASVDLNDVADPTGDNIQMAHLSATFFPENAFIPTARLGYQKNLSGTELSAVNIGLGLFRGVANLDFTYGLESTEVDGNAIPRQFALNVSFEEAF